MRVLMSALIGLSLIIGCTETKKTAENAKSKLQDVAEEASEVIEETASELSEDAKLAGKEIKENVEDLAIKTKEASSEVVRALENDTEAIRQRSKETAQAAKEKLEEAKEKVAEAAEKGAEKVKEASQRLRGSVWARDTFYFDVGSVSLTGEARTKVAKLAGVLRANPGSVVELKGFTDASGSQSLNLQLSQKRIQSVKEALLSSGVEGVRFKEKAFGEEGPVARGASPSESRRVEVIVKKAE